MTDIVVAGGGPGGIAAAVTASKQDARVTVVDDNPNFGGQIWRQGIHKSPHKDARKWLKEMDALNIDFVASTTVLDKQRDEVVCYSEKNGIGRLPADKLILANGARELFLPFPGWTLPGVMGCGGAQAMVKSGMPVQGKKVIVAGSGPLLLAVAAAMVKGGADLRAIVEQADSAKINSFTLSLLTSPGKLLQGARYRLKTLKTPYMTGAWVQKAIGEDCLRSVILGGGGKGEELECDLLACGYGLIPNSELASLIGCESKNDFVTVDDRQQTSVEGVFAIGELTGIGGVDKALLEGRIAALEACGVKQTLSRQKPSVLAFSERLAQTFAVKDEVLKLAEDSTIVCRCEDVTYGDLRSHLDQRSAKLYTRCGMGACQGRICSSSCKELFGWQKNKVNAPLIPLPAEAFALYDNTAQ